jgi:osmoprotectant transport system ATP-binding protein
VTATGERLAAPPASGPRSLRAVDVRHRYGTQTALDGVTLSVDAGRGAALVGESGAGKTTLLRCFNRMVEPNEGRILVGDADVRTLDPVALRRRIGYVPQQGGLMPHWRVLRNAALVPQLLGMPDATDRAVSALTRVGLAAERFGGRYPHELSGGQRQRVALARALAAEPGVILLDEPFGALDAITRAELRDAFAELRGSLTVTTLLVTHDLVEAAALSDELVVMRAGHVEQRGTLDALVSAPATAYVASLVARALAAPIRLRLA